MYSLSDICSLCLIPNQNLKSTLLEDTDGVVVEEKLKVFLYEIVHFKPDIPKYICCKCLLNADYIFKFRLKCLVNLASLNECIKTIEVDAPNKNLSAILSDIKIKKELLESIEFQEQEKQNNSESCETEIKIERNWSPSNIAVAVGDDVEIKQELLFENEAMTSFNEYVAPENANLREENIPTICVMKFEIEEQENAVPLVVKCEIEDPVSNQNNSETYEKETYTTENSVFIKEEPYEFHENTNEMEEDNQKNSPEDVIRMEITETQEMPIESNVTMEQEQENTTSANKNDEHVPANISTETHIPVTFRTKSTGVNLNKSKPATATSTGSANTGTQNANNKYKPRNLDRPKKLPTPTFKMHQSTHVQKWHHKCTTCNTHFQLPEQLKNHLRTHTHTDQEKTHVCEICLKRFAQEASLNSHKQTHINGQSFTCSFCGKVCAGHRHLIKHERSHAGEKPHKQISAGHNNVKHCNCSGCLQGPVQNDASTSHCQMPFSCTLCGKKFATSRALKNHIWTHANVKRQTIPCSLCEYSAGTRKAFRKHMAKHHIGEPPNF